ncbi:MAG: fumarate hydratase [Caldisphaera sp.]|jgi:tartrate/fumarate subfamily iron-sulfur-dependent hydro-lyase alpha chain|nr:fumarate hydratase [Caldisphaera sp.]PMP60435.1 MAG: fumarate hydratase [Caldisphaera sp.]PMP87806.1 MAG: fumarate hydratase [Caldisphaera sp.]
MVITQEGLTSIFYDMIKTTSTSIPVDVYDALKKAYDKETNPAARKQLEAILLDIDIACKKKVPICQDTGTPYFYVEMGENFPIRAGLYKSASEALRKVTKDGYLRPNAVDPFYKKNSGDNTGRYIPWFHYDIVEGDDLKVWFMTKGGGCEAPSTLIMSEPIEGLDKLKRGVVDTIVKYGPLPCPPLIVGISVAAGGDIAMSLAKKALLSPVGERNKDPNLAKMELDILNELNKLELGPHGFGGQLTALDVKIEYAYRHPATYAIGIVTSCWATRRSSAIIHSDGSWELTSKHLFYNGTECVVKR